VPHRFVGILGMGRNSGAAVEAGWPESHRVGGNGNGTPLPPSMLTAAAEDALKRG